MIHVGGWEDEYGIAQKAVKRVCDKWDVVNTVTKLYAACTRKVS